MNTLTPDEVERAMALASQPRPPQILELQAEIEVATRRAAFRQANGLPADIQAIVQMKLDLDDLYIRWTRGELP